MMINLLSHCNTNRFYRKPALIFILALTLFLTRIAAVLGNGEPVKKVIRNITIETPGNQIYDMETNTVFVPDHAKMSIDDVEIEADTVTYYGSKHLAVATGNVRMTRKTVKLYADKLVFSDDTGDLEASGKAHLISPHEEYRAEIIRYNLNTLRGEVGPFQGIVKNPVRDYYLHGDTAKLEPDATEILPAGLTRCPRKDRPDYIFNAKKMRIVGDDIYLERVVVRVLGVPVLYLPHLRLRQGEQAPKFNMDANQGDELELRAAESSEDMEAAPKIVRSYWLYRIEMNTARPSKLALGRGWDWGRYSNHVDLEFNSQGFLSLVDGFEYDWAKYYLTVDGKTDLNAEPERELGIAFTRKTLQTKYGSLQASLLARLLYKENDSQNYQGIYGGYRLDYQPFSLLSCSYVYLDDLTGTQQDWDEVIEPDFLVIKNYRLGGNLLYNLKIPLNEHYSLANKGAYNFPDSSWTSQSLILFREVCCIRAGIGWDFAKDLIELRFRLNY
jgi:lipopolysaccharide export system protein LptA